jgi:hypothetical protein
VTPLSGGSGETLQDCGGSYPQVVADHAVQPEGAQAECTCTCGTVTGASCTYLMNHYAAGMCGGAPVVTAVPVLNSCVNIANTTHTQWNLIANPMGGSCSPSSSEVIPDAGYAGQLRVCGAEVLPAECGGDEVCAPLPSAPFNGQICIYQEGDHECPAGVFSERTVEFTSYTDSRECAPACSCDSPVGECTGATGTLYRDTDNCTVGGQCFNPPCLEYIDQGCVGVGVSEVRSLRRTANATYAGTCEPAGYDHTGEVTPTGPVTMCCTA